MGKATDFSESDISCFKIIVIEAGEVGEAAFEGLIAKNPTLIFIPNTIDIEAVGALKIPHDEYKVNVFTKSKSNENPGSFNYELGWIVSKKKGQGNGKKIVEKLLLESNIYATVRKENCVMKHILEKFEFEKSGEKYKSDRDNYDLELYIRKKKNAL